MKKKTKQSYWQIILIIIAIILIALIYFLFFFPCLGCGSIPFSKTPNTALIPEPYKNPNYCDENIDCGFFSYKTGGGVFCGNTYYVNATEPEIAFDIACICNITENKCITLSANK